MSARKRQRRVVVSDSEEEPGDVADGALATAPFPLGRLHRAGEGTAAAEDDVIDLCDEPAPGSAARVPPPPGELVTPQPARQPEAPTTLRRGGLRDRAPSSRKAPQRAALAQIQRKRAGAAALEDSSEDEGGLSGSGSGRGAEESGAGEGSENEEPSCGSSDDDGFIVSDKDEEGADAARQLLRGMIGGRAMDESLRLQLYAQLRLLRLLGVLPHAGSLSDEVKAVIAAALSIERNLSQFAAQSQNLEHWRKADSGLQARFEEYEALETEEGGYRWGKHCSFCRHDRHRQIGMLTLCFLGRRQPVALLEPILAQRGLLPGSGPAAADEHGTPDQPAVGHDGNKSEGGSGASSASSSSSSEDDEPLSAGYARRQALRRQQERQAQRAQRAQRRQQQVGTPLRARQAARELAAAGDGGSSEEDSLLGGAAQRQRQVGRKRQRATIESSDEDKEQEEEQAEKQPASSQEGSQQQQEGEGIAGQGGEEEQWAHGTDPDASDSSASELGKRPRRRPRIGTDCWARAYVYRSLHRYPARLDAMLLVCTRRYLATTPEAEQPCSRAGLAHAVLQRYGHALVKHYNEFMYSINSYNLLQNRKSDKSFANSCIVNELKSLQYARCTELSPEEELWGVGSGAELAGFTAGAGQRRQRRLDAAAAAAGGDAAAAAEEVEAEEDCGRLLLLRAAGGGGPDAADSEEEGEGGDVHYAAEEQQEEPEEPGQRRRPRQRRTQQQQERLEAALFQRQRRQGTAQQGGQRAAAAIAAAAANYGGEGGGIGDELQGSVGRAAEQPGSEQQQRQQEEVAPRDRNACFHCGGAGHWSAACPERQRCYHCKQIGHWSQNCPQRGSCYKCKQPGHWAANCPNGPNG